MAGYTPLGLDTGAQCFSDDHVEHGDSSTIGTPQLPQEVREASIACYVSMDKSVVLIHVYGEVIVSFVVN